LSNLTDWVTNVVEALGYVGVAILILVENVFPPIPSEIILPLAGFMSSRGDFWLPAVIVAATLGSVGGALVLYWLGALLGEDRLRRLVARTGHIARITSHDLDRAEHWFDRYGRWAVLLGRLVPIVRSLISLPAGVARMPLGTFIVFTAIGSCLWNTILIGAGWLLGDQWDRVEQYVRIFQYLVIVAVLAIAAWWLLRRRARRRTSEALR
jgi:membrane protein DedA with SNARE-associated domain